MTYIKPLIFWSLAAGLMIFGIEGMYPEKSELIPFMGYMVLSNSFLTLPHEPVVLYLGKTFGWIWPVVVAIIPTIIGSYLDYQIFDPLRNIAVMNRLKNKRWYRKIFHYFSLYPFATITVFALTPLPFYTVRILSIFGEYPAGRYVQAALLGRIPRYLFLAAGGKLLNMENKLIIFVALAVFVLYGAGILYRKYRKLDCYN
ncbi:MAG: hypothetical protein E4H13_08235, partial [Calditrichales bacterium]